MKRLTKAICMVLVLFVMTAFKVDSVSTLLVLTDINNNESFSKFNVSNQDGILVGRNVDDYPVNNGLYRIHASSKNKYYNHNILIIGD